MPSNLIANRPRIGYVLPVRFDGDRVVDKSEPSDFLRLDGQCSALFFFFFLFSSLKNHFPLLVEEGRQMERPFLLRIWSGLGRTNNFVSCSSCRFLSFLEEEDDDMNRWQVDRPAVFHRCRVEIVRWLTNGRVRLTYESINDVRPKTEMRFKFRVRLRKWFEKLAANYDQHLEGNLARSSKLPGAEKMMVSSARAITNPDLCIVRNLWTNPSL